MVELIKPRTLCLFAAAILSALCNHIAMAERNPNPFLKEVTINKDQSQIFLFRNGASCLKRADFITVSQSQKSLALLSVFRQTSGKETRVEKGRALSATFEELEAARFSLCFEYGEERLTAEEYGEALAVYETLSQEYIRGTVRTAVPAQLSFLDLHFEDAKGDLETFPVLSVAIRNSGQVTLVKRAEFWVEKVWIWKPVVLPYSEEGSRFYNVLLPVEGAPYKVGVRISQAIAQSGVDQFRFTIGNDGAYGEGTTRYIFLCRLRLVYDEDDKVASSNDLAFVSYPPADVIASTAGAGDYPYERYVRNRVSFRQISKIAAVRSAALDDLLSTSKEDYEKPIVPRLVGRLTSGDPRARIDACEFLGFLGREASPAIPQLQNLLHDPEQGVRDAATQAISKIQNSPIPPGVTFERVTADQWAAIPLKMTKESASLDAEAQLKLAREEEFEKKYGDAIAAYSRAITRDPNNGKAFLGRCYCKLQLDNYAGVVEDCTRVLSISTESEILAFAFYNRGVARGFLKDEEAAMGDFDRAFRSLPNLDRSSDILKDRGRVRMQMGDFVGADDDFQRHLQLNPKDDQAHAELGRLKVLQNDKTGGMAELRKASEINPNEMYHKLWIAGFGGGTEALRTNGEKSEWLASIAAMYMGQLSEAELLERAKKIKNDQTEEQRLCEAYTYIALKHESHGDKTVAMKDYAAALATDVTGYIEYRWSAARLKQIRDSVQPK
jgi:lipoprotein NlpI